jgi:transcriptional regulator with XRE-family HTH domain
MGCVKRQLRVRAALREPCDTIPFDPTDVQIGSRLRRTRIFRDLTQCELARRIGATEREVEAFESGATPIDAWQALKISRVLDVRPSFFLPGSARGVSDAEELMEPSARGEPPEPCVGGAAGERVREIYESISSPKIRKLLVDLMLVITASEHGGRHLM